MPFTPGDHVHIAALGKGIVRDVRNRGRYVVELKGRTMVVGESQLTAVEAVRAAKRAKQPKKSDEPAASHPLERTHAASSIDLHGMTTDEAVHALDEFLNDAILASLDEVHIVHGRSGGRLKAAIHARLKQLRPVRAFRMDPRNPGVTIVTL